MISSIIRESTASKIEKMEKFDAASFEKKVAVTESQFRVFHDYLGLIDLVQPMGFISALDSLKAEMDFAPSLFGNQRQRMDSLDSDAISDSSSSGGSRSESDLLLESISSCDSSPYSPKGQSESAISQQTYAQTLESIIAGQKNVINRMAQANKDSRGTKNSNKATVCVFCRNNGESQEFFRSHTLKDSEGNTTCPILRAYTCPLCKENGDKSHTIKYCPKYTPKVKTDRLLVMPGL
jgi:protein nanos 1